MQRFTELKVWQRGHALVLKVYRLTTGFPLVERYGLTSQLRRAILSVPTNIAEGSKRVSNQEYARFLNMAEASLAEAEYLLLVSRDLEYATSAAVNACFTDVAALASMLHGLRKKVEGIMIQRLAPRVFLDRACLLLCFNLHALPLPFSGTRAQNAQGLEGVSSSLTLTFNFQLSTLDSQHAHKLSHRTASRRARFSSSYFNFQLSTFDIQLRRKSSHCRASRRARFSSSYFNFQLSTFDSQLRRKSSHTTSNQPATLYAH